MVGWFSKSLTRPVKPTSLNFFSTWSDAFEPATGMGCQQAVASKSAVKRAENKAWSKEIEDYPLVI